MRRPHPPEASPTLRRVAGLVMAPVERFLHVEAASGIVLLAATALALAWANSPWAASYEHLWHTPIGLRVGAVDFERPLHFWINDGLMTVFFFVVGLEIRRELHHGELSERRRAALPVVAALGGMIVPACIFLAIASRSEARDGWGAAVATDIAFAVGVLALLGKRVRPALRILLLALAVIDDIGAIIVIALFYSSGVSLTGFAVALAGVGWILAQRKLGVRHALLYVPPALVVWAGTYVSGVHPTIAGVVIGLLTPAAAWLGTDGFLDEARSHVATFDDVARHPKHTEHDLVAPLAAIAHARREAISPVERLQAALHPWVAFGVMPLFAFANAGVTLHMPAEGGAGLVASLGIALGLVLGKPIGIVLACVVSAKIGLSVLPRGVGVRGLLLVGIVGGIGFTMSLFVAELAFGRGPLLDAAKIGILAASTTAAVLGLGYGRIAFARSSPEPDESVAASPVSAESSTEA